MGNIVISASGDPLSDMVLTQDVISEASKDPLSIGRLMVDQVYSEGRSDLDGHALYFEHRSNAKRILSDYESGMEGAITGGWVRAMTPPKLFLKEQRSIQQMINHGDAVDHGTYRGVRLIEFRITKAPVIMRSKPKGFARG